MTHVFVSPHPDDAALSCGGLIASLRELGQNVAIVTVFSGNGSAEHLTSYQREALGFGSKALWPVTEAFNRANIPNDVGLGDEPLPPWAATADRLDATQADADAAAKRFWQRSSWYRRASIHNESLAGQPVSDQLPTQGAVMTIELTEAEAMAHPRRHEVFRDVGSRRRAPDEEDFIEVKEFLFKLDSAILLCSDGLSDLLTSAEILEVIERYNGDAADVPRELVEAANVAGGNDNITAIFVAGSEFLGNASSAAAEDRH